MFRIKRFPRDREGACGGFKEHRAVLETQGRMWWKDCGRGVPRASNKTSSSSSAPPQVQASRRHEHVNLDQHLVRAFVAVCLDAVVAFRVVGLPPVPLSRLLYTARVGCVKGKFDEAKHDPTKIPCRLPAALGIKSMTLNVATIHIHVQCPLHPPVQRTNGL